MSESPDEIIDYRPERCDGCGAELEAGADQGYAARQVVEVPAVTPEVTEHRAHTLGCGCGHRTTAALPGGVRAPVSHGPRARGHVAYLLGRQHIPNRRVAETMADLFGLDISIGAVDSIYAEAGRRLPGFVAALVARLRSLPVLHADETTDRLGTTNCWMHVVSTGLYMLIHASVTRGGEAIDQAGGLRGYRGVVVHDRICSATQPTSPWWPPRPPGRAPSPPSWWRSNIACNDARRRGLKSFASARQRVFTGRYDGLVADGLGANPEPMYRKRNSVERRSFNLATAFATHRRSILRYRYNLDVSFTNNQAERDLRPTKLHRKISGCFRSQAVPSGSPTSAATCQRHARTVLAVATARLSSIGAPGAPIRC